MTTHMQRYGEYKRCDAMVLDWLIRICKATKFDLSALHNGRSLGFGDGSIHIVVSDIPKLARHIHEVVLPNYRPLLKDVVDIDIQLRRSIKLRMEQAADYKARGIPDVNDGHAHFLDCLRASQNFLEKASTDLKHSQRKNMCHESTLPRSGSAKTNKFANLTDECRDNGVAAGGDNVEKVFTEDTSNLNIVQPRIFISDDTLGAQAAVTQFLLDIEQAFTFAIAAWEESSRVDTASMIANGAVAIVMNLLNQLTYWHPKFKSVESLQMFIHQHKEIFSSEDVGASALRLETAAAWLNGAWKQLHMTERAKPLEMIDSEGASSALRSSSQLAENTISVITASFYLYRHIKKTGSLIMDECTRHIGSALENSASHGALITPLSAFSCALLIGIHSKAQKVTGSCTIASMAREDLDHAQQSLLKALEETGKQLEEDCGDHGSLASQSKPKKRNRVGGFSSKVKGPTLSKTDLLKARGVEVRARKEATTDHHAATSNEECKVDEKSTRLGEFKHMVENVKSSILCSLREDLLAQESAEFNRNCGYGDEAGKDLMAWNPLTCGTLLFCLKMLERLLALYAICHSFGVFGFYFLQGVKQVGMEWDWPIFDEYHELDGYTKLGMYESHETVKREHLISRMISHSGLKAGTNVEIASADDSGKYLRSHIHGRLEMIRRITSILHSHPFLSATEEWVLENRARWSGEWLSQCLNLSPARNEAKSEEASDKLEALRVLFISVENTLSFDHMRLYQEMRIVISAVYEIVKKHMPGQQDGSNTSWRWKSCMWRLVSEIFGQEPLELESSKRQIAKAIAKLVKDSLGTGATKEA